MELTEQQAREELGKLSLEELIALAEEQGKPTAVQSRANLIELLLGNCPACKGSITVVIISSRTRKQSIQKQIKGGAPCIGCGK